MQPIDNVLHPNLIEEIKKLGGLIKEIKVSMMTTVDERGKMHSRPMLTQQVEFDGDLWFFASASSQIIEELKWNRQVHLNFISSEKNKFISISGTGQIVRDPDRARQLWDPIYQMWFPKGLADADLILLKVEVEQAEYWDSSSSKVVQVIDVGRFIKIKKEKVRVPEHKKLDLTG